MVEVPNHLSEYKKENVCELLHMIKAIVSNKKITYKALSEKSGMDGDSSVFSKIKNDATSNWQKIKQGDYKKLISYIFEEDLYVPSDAMAAIALYDDYFYYALLPYLSIDLSLQNVLSKKICGFYHVYHNSFSEKGHYVRGYAYIYKSSTSKALCIDQVFRVQPQQLNKESRSTKLKHRERIEKISGHIVEISGTSTCAIFAKNMTTNMPYFVFLPHADVEADKGDTIVTVKRGIVLTTHGQRASTSRIYYERIDYNEEDIDKFRANLEKECNIYPSELIPNPVLSHLKQDDERKVDIC